MDRIRRHRPRHRQLLHGDVLHAVGAVRVAQPCTPRPMGLHARPRTAAAAAVCDCRADRDPDCLLRHCAAPGSEPAFHRFLVEDRDRGAVAERPGVVHLGAVRVRFSRRLHVPDQRAQPRRHQQAIWPRLRPAGDLLPVSRRGDRHRLRAVAPVLRTELLVRIRSVLGAGQPRAAVCGLLLHRCRHRRGEFQPRRVQCRWTAGEKHVGMVRGDAGALLPVVGPDLYQARGPRESGRSADVV